jgi:hypothetical protein
LSDLGLCQTILSELIMWKTCLVSERAWMSYDHSRSKLAEMSSTSLCGTKVKESKDDYKCSVTRKRTLELTRHVV